MPTAPIKSKGAAIRHNFDPDWIDVEPPQSVHAAPYETLRSFERAERRSKFWKITILWALWLAGMAFAAWWIPRINWGG
jgi:hypothetical protein